MTQIKEAVLSGITLEDDKREQFNKIEQVRYGVLLNIVFSLFYTPVMSLLKCTFNKWKIQ
ncbi:hypothetical protein P3L10_006640 [Capsicum annuum]